jgi:hypothetical protein
MAEREPPEIEFISPNEGYVMMKDGTRLPITSFFDNEGEFCEWQDAIALVAGLDEYGYVTIVEPEGFKAHARKVH